MLRSDLFALATKHGKERGKKPALAARTRIENDLRAYFTSAEGRQALEDAPRIHFEVRGEQKDRQMSADDATAALLEEVDAA